MRKQKTAKRGKRMVDKEQFGAFIRRKREEQGEYGLREMAKKIGISPTYLSKCERDEFPPPSEDRVREIAKILGRDVDDLLARAGRVSSDISDIIKRHPVQLSALLRTTKGMSADDINRLANEAENLENIADKWQMAEGECDELRAEVERLREVAGKALDALDSDHPDIQLRVATALRAALKETK